MILHHATVEQRENEEDINEIGFKSKIDKTSLLEYIDQYYHGKNKKVVFVAMIGSNSNDYFITDSYMKVQKYFLDGDVNKTYFLFEEPTYEEALMYCKDLCEIHELGLNP